jgi:hypothetical protein
MEPPGIPGRFTAQALGVVAGGLQQLPGMVYADPQQSQGARRGLGDQLAQPLVGELDLLLQGQDTYRYRLERRLGRLDGVVKPGSVGSQPDTGRHLPGGRSPVQRLADGGRGGDHHGLEALS